MVSSLTVTATCTKIFSYIPHPSLIRTSLPLPWPSFSKAPNFPDLVQRLLESITTLGGAVFPKLNWSSPKVSTE